MAEVHCVANRLLTGYNATFPFSATVVILLAGIGWEDAAVYSRSMGSGIVSPPTHAGYVLYLYEEPADLSMLIPEASPLDSLVMDSGKYHVELRNADRRTDIRPLGYKLDYGIFFFRAKTISRFWYEIVVDENTRTTSWVSSLDLSFADWPTFLLGVNSVERIDMATNPLRAAPDEEAATIPYSMDRECLSVLAIRGDWMRVRSSEVCGEVLIHDAWIRWRSGERMLITYNLLS